MCKNGGKFILTKGTCKMKENKRYCQCSAYSYGEFCEKLKCEFCETQKCKSKNKCETCYNATTQHEICKYYACENYNLCQNKGININNRFM